MFGVVGTYERKKMYTKLSASLERTKGRIAKKGRWSLEKGGSEISTRQAVTDLIYRIR